jgi:signal transduction histidine kinase
VRLLSRGVDQAAYRILQESLTNAARHGAGAATVSIHYGANELELTVRNPRGAAPAGVDGHGILGMRERAELLGGSVDTRRAGDAFVVHARLPYGEPA